MEEPYHSSLSSSRTTTTSAPSSRHGTWTADIDTTPRRVSVVHSARIPAHLSERLEDEAARRGITPSKLIAELVEQGLTQRDADATVTMRLSDLHRAIDTIAQQAA